MFFKYNYDNFPNIYIDLSGYINNDDDFKLFTQEWLSIYERKQQFTLFFNTKNLQGSNLKYTIYMAFFIKKIKSLKYNYLIESKIYIYNKYIFKLAKLIFYFEKPIAKIELLLYENNKIIENSIILP